ncbi:unnamed protein product [Rhizoctonia solani]|uniref:Granulins domain-containing protein n=1 Tax=Rhizoctonia solani TaxID=456999 RepID=A0A8H3GJT5_9AGAM|nr:unnamed protein product [Rhizoctonia solani]
MRTATFTSFICFFFFALVGVANAMPEPIQVGSIVARDANAVPAKDGLGGLIARGDDDHHNGGDDDHDYDYDNHNDYCWKKDGWNKCSKWNYCCEKYQTCCGGSKCCDKGYKCVREGKDDYSYDDEHHKRGKDDDYHHGKDDDYNHGKDDDHHHYEWVCKKDEHHW